MLLQLHWSMSWRVATLDPKGSTAKGLRVSTEIYFDPLMIPTGLGSGGLRDGPCPQAWIIAALKLERFQISTRPGANSTKLKQPTQAQSALALRAEAPRERRPCGAPPGHARASDVPGREGEPPATKEGRHSAWRAQEEN